MNFPFLLVWTCANRINFLVFFFLIWYQKRFSVMFGFSSLSFFPHQFYILFLLIHINFFSRSIVKQQQKKKENTFKQKKKPKNSFVMLTTSSNPVQTRQYFANNHKLSSRYKRIRSREYWTCKFIWIILQSFSWQWEKAFSCEVFWSRLWSRKKAIEIRKIKHKTERKMNRKKNKLKRKLKRSKKNELIDMIR